MLRKTKIIATVGPACSHENMLRALIKQGTDVFRINASHSTPQDIKQWVRLIRKVASTSRKTVSIMVDLQGPRLRTGKLEGEKPLLLKKGEEVYVSTGSELSRGNRITTSCRQLPLMVKAGDPILLDNGLIELKVLSVTKKQVLCRVIEEGELGQNKGINLPNAPITLPALSAKDLRDLKASVDVSVDFIALSFVRTKEDVLTLKHWLHRRGKNIPVIAKIEKPRAVKEIQSIVACADAIMVARGDLGIEMGVEKVPFIQKELIAEANRMCVPVITATQMLESMMNHSRPTRAEASDIANAVFDGSDAVMLSGETAIGKFPMESVQVMEDIIMEAERHVEDMPARFLTEGKFQYETTEVGAIAHAARHAARDLPAKAIFVFTRTGKTAALISRFRPECPIIALAPSEEARRKLNLFRGVIALKISYGKSTDTMIRQGERAVRHAGLVKPGDDVVLLSGKNALPSARYLAKIQKVGRS